MTLLWSAAGIVLLALGLAGSGHWGTAHVLALRNALGYGHFALAYVFTWGMIRRQLGSRDAAAYLAAFGALVIAYAAAQRLWLSRPTNDVFVMVLFGLHHFANEVLIRRQSANGYQPFTWTRSDTLLVVLLTGLVPVERIGGPVVAAAWAGCWAAYAWSRRHEPVPAVFSCLALGALAVLAVARPIDRPLLTSRLAFDWLVIYHYVLWYVFYTRKLLHRTAGWTTSRPVRSAAALWAYVTTVPVGFVGLAVVGNVVIMGALLAARPVANRAETWTGLDLFQVNTVAHILFGVGIARLAALRAPQAAVAAAQSAALENKIVTAPAPISSRRAS